MVRFDSPLRLSMIVVALAALLLCPVQGRAQDEPAAEESELIPPAPEVYLGRRIAQTMHYAGAPWLIRESREREEGTRLFLEELGVEEGLTVCDVGCGNGFYALPIAEMVGAAGRVVGVDIQPEMLELLGARAEDAGIENIEPVLGSIVNPNLEPGTIDLAILIDVYHEFSHPVQMLGHLRESLAPGGRMVLLEFRAEDPGVPIKELHKMSKEQVNKEMAANGFKPESEFDGLPWQHMMTFVVDPEWEPEDAGG
jgi:SAM-dependent methyltransferase